MANLEASYDESYMSIVYCPCCCTNLDAEGTGVLAFECNNCDTHFTVTVDRAKFSEHSMNS